MVLRLKIRINLPELLKGRFRIGSLIMEGLKLGYERLPPPGLRGQPVLKIPGRRRLIRKDMMNGHFVL